MTVDAGLVYPNAYARRGGLHVDGFMTQANIHARRGEVLWGDNTYLISDNPELQTECYPGPFDLTGINTDDASAVLKVFDAQEHNMSYVQYKPYDIIKLTTNNIHAVHPNMTGSVLNRCFVKVTFSERLFNRGGNTVNPHLNYRLLYKPAPSEGAHIYAPNGDRRLRAFEVTRNVTFPASWGTRQTIPAGGYILDDGQGDTWGVHPESFKATYQQCRLL